MCWSVDLLMIARRRASCQKTAGNMGLQDTAAKTCTPINRPCCTLSRFPGRQGRTKDLDEAQSRELAGIPLDKCGTS